MAVTAQEAILGFQAPALAKRPSQFDGRPERSYESGILPRLLYEVARTEAHGLHGEVDTPPCRHHHDGQEIVVGTQALEEIEAFRPRGRIAGVIEIDEHDVEDARANGAVDGRGRRGLLNGEAFVLQEETECLHHVGLIVSDENARGLGHYCTIQPSCSRMTREP